jgi:phosphoglycolate phosphatase-like HAD superfamily hydrolase
MAKVGRGSWSLGLLAALVALVLFGRAWASADPLPSWNEGPAKRAILELVESVTREGSDQYVPPPDRIAVFDNDGTLWVEQPLYVQGVFALERARELAAGDPELASRPAFRALLDHDEEAIAAFGEEEIGEIVAATHAGMTQEDFHDLAAAWLARARHPRFDCRYRDLTYRPQIELLEYLRDNGFSTFIVSGGGVDFIRAFSENAYGIGRDRVIGSSNETELEVRDGRSVLVKQPELSSLDDGEAKPSNIGLHVGRRPILAFGNSDGDLQMLQYTTSGESPALALVLHHDDSKREYAYDRDSRVGRLDEALDEAKERGWTVVSMKADWRRVFDGGCP